MNKKHFIIPALLFISIFCISTYTFSQTEDKRSNKTPEEIATKKATKMKEYLSLTDEQYSSVYNILLQKIKDKQINKEKYKGMDKETRKQMKQQSRAEFKKQLESILNKDQLTKFQEMKGKHKHNKDNKNKEKKKNIE